MLRIIKISLTFAVIYLFYSFFLMPEKYSASLSIKIKDDKNSSLEIPIIPNFYSTDSEINELEHYLASDISYDEIIVLGNKIQEQKFPKRKFFDVKNYTNNDTKSFLKDNVSLKINDSNILVIRVEGYSSEDAKLLSQLFLVSAQRYFDRKIQYMSYISKINSLCNLVPSNTDIYEENFLFDEKFINNFVNGDIFIDAYSQKLKECQLNINNDESAAFRSFPTQLYEDISENVLNALYGEIINSNKVGNSISDKIILVTPPHASKNPIHKKSILFSFIIFIAMILILFGARVMSTIFKDYS